MSNTLLPEVAEKYLLKTIRPGNFVFPGFGELDLRKISLKKADDLYQRKFPYLILKKPIDELKIEPDMETEIESTLDQEKPSKKKSKKK